MIMKKTKLSRQEMNVISNAILSDLFRERNIDYCEVCRTDRSIFKDCSQLLGLTFSHRKKRRHYKTVEELSDFNEVVLSCLNSHMITERDPVLTEMVFKELRG